MEVFQQGVWAEYDTGIGGTKLVESCKPDLSAEEITSSLNFLFQSLDKRELVLSANRMVADLYLKIDIFERKRNSGVKMLDQMRKYAEQK